jgi:hypothetical protein
MVCRMELGRGASSSLGSWAAVAASLGVDLFAVVSERESQRQDDIELRCHTLTAEVARGGDWTATTEIVRASPARAPSSVETILVRPARNEAAVVRAWHPVPNMGVARRISELAPRLATVLRATSGARMTALRHARSPMPSDGLLWTDRWAEQFKPAGRHPGWQRHV